MSVLDVDIDPALLADLADALHAELTVLAPMCERDGCTQPRAVGRRQLCDSCAAASGQESKNRWWRRNGAAWRDRREAA